MSLSLVAMLWLLSLPLALLTMVGSRRRGENVGPAIAYGLAFPATWVIWLVQDNHRAGRKAFQTR